MESMSGPTGTDKTSPLSVYQLTMHIKNHLEPAFPRLWLRGEISNFTQARSGHWYFSLKDDQAQIRSTMWRSAAQRVAIRPRDGMDVLVAGSINVYPPRGEYTLNVETLEELGLGSLRQQFEKLKQKLQAEGLFDAEHKKALPFFPRRIGIVTSPTGAAIRDLLRVIQQRFRGPDILIYPARVQGEGAAAEIMQGLQTLDRHGACDVIIIGRGGGSEEDLWCFNDEALARAIFEAHTPIISAVGHEVDFTISDFVADLRAATPSHAGESVIRSRTEYAAMVSTLQKELRAAIQRTLLSLRARVHVSESHPVFIRARSRLNAAQRRVVDLEHQLESKTQRRLQDLRDRWQRLTRFFRIERLLHAHGDLRHRVQHAKDQLHATAQQQAEERKTCVDRLMDRLQGLSPHAIMQRGYAMVFDARRRLVRSPEDVRFGQVLDVHVHRGELRARVIEDSPRHEQATLFDPEEIS